MTRAPGRTRSFAAAAIIALAATGCGVGSVTGSSSSSSGDKAVDAKPKVSQVTFAANVRRQAPAVDVDKRLALTARSGQWEHVTLTGPGGSVPGKLSPDQTVWRSTANLAPDTAYTIKGVAVDAEGLRKNYSNSFHTRKLSLDEQTYPSFVPTANSTVGVAMPVIIRFDVPVTDKASIEKHLSVQATPAQQGAWHWISDNEVHWRPAQYWKAGTTVKVNADIGGVKAGNGIYGQLNRSITFHVGRSLISRVNAQTHQMEVIRDGKLLRTIPITTGKEGFTTRSGTKVIIEKFPQKRMNSETVGIARNSPEAYDIDDVKWAQRVTYSGEFLHAAPWSVSSQGHANVSHGCTGMSTDNAAWYYQQTMIGDPVEYTGTDRPMTLDNGYGDWNESFAQYKQGSAL